MIALFETIETREPGPLPMRSSAAASSASSAARAAASSADDAFALIRRTSPVLVAGAVPEQRLDALEERRREAPETLLGTELEDAVRLDPGGLRGPPVSARRRGLHPVERGGDDVEVRRLRRVLPFLRDRAPTGRRPRTPTVASSASGATRRPAAARRHEARAEAREGRLDATRRGAVAREEARLEVGERRRRAVAERDRLLDLEVLRDAPVADAAPVLDRDEAEEPVELTGPAQRLLGRERSSPEALEPALDALQGRADSLAGARRDHRATCARRAASVPSSRSRHARRASPRCAR